MNTDHTPRIVATAILLDFVALAFSGMTVATYLDYDLPVPPAALNLFGFEVALLVALAIVYYLHRSLDRRSR